MKLKFKKLTDLFIESGSQTSCSTNFCL